MRIAQVAPLFESVPPKHYGGTERIVSYLTEELVRAGHDVTLFASGDSVTQARLIAGSARSLRLDRRCIDHLAHHVVMLDRLFQRAREFDVIHFHLDYLHFPFVSRCSVPHITTLHGRLDIPDLAPLYEQFRDIPVISISDAQREPLPWVNWRGTIYHGLPEDLFHFRPNPGNYLAFLGRIAPEKRVDRAIEIAKRTGMLLKIAAKVDKADKRYFKRVIEPLLDDSFVEWVGEITDEQKEDFLGNAYALLFPIDWPEPFGLVMIEAMACGTPVIAYDDGSVPEVLEEGRTGFIVTKLQDATEAVDRVASLSRARCRRVFEKRFTSTRMARDYVKAYRSIVERSLTEGDYPGGNRHGALPATRRRVPAPSVAKGENLTGTDRKFPVSSLVQP